jgi:anti-sigma factor RsiW
MADSFHELEDYLFDELGPEERAAVEERLRSSPEAREELERLKMTRQSLLVLADEEVPRRVAFVSDKVFEPSPWLRWWRAAWEGAPRFALAMTPAVLALVAGLWLLKPTVTVEQGRWQLAFGEAAQSVPQVQQARNPDVPALTEEQVRAVVQTALAESEQRQREALTRLVVEQSQRSNAAWKSAVDDLAKNSEAAWQYTDKKIQNLLYPMGAGL